MSEGRILVVDDEPQIQRFLKPALTAAGYQPIEALTAADAERLVATAAPDLVILDLGLPDKDGKDVIRSLRSWSKLPIVVLSARDREIEKIEALDLGADDYVEKPFGIGELLARIRTALRRRDAGTLAASRFEADGLSIDFARRIVLRQGEPVHLTPKEYDLLSHMARHAGLVMTPSAIAQFGVGAGPCRGRALPARLHRPAAHQDRARPRPAGPYPHRAGRRLPVRAVGV